MLRKDLKNRNFYFKILILINKKNFFNYEKFNNFYICPKNYLINL